MNIDTGDGWTDGRSVDHLHNRKRSNENEILENGKPGKEGKSCCLIKGKCFKTQNCEQKVFSPKSWV